MTMYKYYAFVSFGVLQLLNHRTAVSRSTYFNANSIAVTIAARAYRRLGLTWNGVRNGTEPIVYRKNVYRLVSSWI